MGCKNALVTLGKQGSVYIWEGKTMHQECIPIQVVDTTAAGDTFTGYFVAGIAAGDGMADVLRVASAASAISVTRNGAAPSIPTRAEVMARMGELKPSKTDDKSERIRRQIDAYIAADLKAASLDGLARMLGYSSVYSGFLIKKLTGRSFSKLLQDKRCAVAAEMLLHTERPIHEIIGEVGYENESFFRKIFEKKYSKKPLEFRKRGVK